MHNKLWEIRNKIQIFLKSGHDVISYKLDQYLKPGDQRLSPEQIIVLLTLYQGKKINQKEMREQFHLSKATLSERIKKLETLGFLRKETDEKDKRKQKLILTDQCINVIDNGKKVINEIDTEISKGITQEELDTVSAVLDKMINNIQRLKEEENA